MEIKNSYRLNLINQVNEDKLTTPCPFSSKEEVNIWKSEQDRKVLFLYPKTEKRKENSMETIISSCITATVTLVICLLNNHGQQEKTRALMEYKLDELTKRVDEHNHVVERTYSIERELSIQKEQIKVANHRIEDLEGIEHEH